MILSIVLTTTLLKGNKEAKLATFADILYGAPQSSILGLLLLNICNSDMFYYIDKYDIASYADHNTPYTRDFNLEEVMQKLELITNNLFEWLKHSHMKEDSFKYRQLVTRQTDVTAKFGEFDFKISRKEKLVVKIDTKLSFKNRVFSLCKKASQKLDALARVVNFMDLATRKSPMKAFIISQFNYCPLIWMFHSLETSIQG